MKTIIGLVLLFCLALPATGRAADEWTGNDKMAHFMVSWAISQGGYGLSIGLAPQRPGTAMAIGGSLSMAAGLGKECFDAARGGSFSHRDLVWDTLGNLTGLLVSQGLYLLWQAR